MYIEKLISSISTFFILEKKTTDFTKLDLYTKRINNCYYALTAIYKDYNLKIILTQIANTTGQHLFIDEINAVGELGKYNGFSYINSESFLNKNPEVFEDFLQIIQKEIIKKI